MLEVNVFGLKFGVGLGLVGEIRDCVELIWGLIPAHIRNQLRARAGDLLPLSVIATNHDLQRGVRIAWGNATIQIVTPILTEARTHLNNHKGDAEANQVVTFCTVLVGAVRRMRDRDLDVSVPLAGSPVDGHIEMILDLAGKWIAGHGKPEAAEAMVAAFGTTSAALVGLESEQVPPVVLLAAANGVGEHPRSFGVLLFDKFGEFIKGDEYKEVREAFGVRLQVLMQEQLDRIERKIGETPERVVELIEERVVPRIAEQLAQRLAMTPAQAETVISNTLQRVYREEQARTAGEVDPEVVRQRLDALVLSLTEADLRRRGDDAIDRRLDDMEALVARGDAERASEAYLHAWKRFELERNEARGIAALNARKLLRFGINHAIANRDYNAAAERIADNARSAAGEGVATQFDALDKAYRDWKLRMPTSRPTELDRLVAWRLAQTLEQEGFDASRAFRGLAASGSRWVALQFGEGPPVWDKETIAFTRAMRSRAVLATVAALREAGMDRSLAAELSALEGYARRLELGVNPEDSEVEMEIWELRSAPHAFASSIVEPATDRPFRRIFDHAALRLVSKGAKIDPLSPPIAAMIAGQAPRPGPYGGPFQAGFCFSPPAKFGGELQRRKSWGTGDAAKGIAKLEMALRFADGQPPADVGDVHLALGNAYRDRFWWEGNPAFGESAQTHLQAAADAFAKSAGAAEVLGTILARAADEMGRVLAVIAAPPVAPATPVEAPRTKKGLFGF